MYGVKVAQKQVFFLLFFYYLKLIELGAIFQAWNGIVLNVAGCGREIAAFLSFYEVLKIKWLTKLLRSLKGGHVRFLELKNFEFFKEIDRQTYKSNRNCYLKEILVRTPVKQLDYWLLVSLGVIVDLAFSFIPDHLLEISSS